MSLFTIRYFVTLFVILRFARSIVASCEIRDYEIIETGEKHVIECETLYVCDEENQLHTYPACIGPRCENSTKIRDLDISQPWPKCCARYSCCFNYVLT